MQLTLFLAGLIVLCGCGGGGGGGEGSAGGSSGTSAILSYNALADLSGEGRLDMIVTDAVDVLVFLHDAGGGVTFAAPNGMITAKDVPDGCGLILRSERGWRHTRKPTLKPATPIPTAVWVKLISARPNTSISLRAPRVCRSPNAHA